MTSHPPVGSPGDQPPGALAPAVCKRPGCGNPLPGQARGRARQFCGDDCARRYHNDSRTPAAPAALPADSTDPLAALEAVIRQAALLTRTAREQAAALDPARVRAQIAEAEAARRRAEAAAVTAAARTAEADAEVQALAEALDAARADTRAAQAAETAAHQAASNATAELGQARQQATAQIAQARAEAGAQVNAAQAEATRSARERDEALAAARHADAVISRARQAEADARAETTQARADAARERDTLRDQHQAQLDAVGALTAAEHARAERAETQLETERTDRRHLTSQLTATPSPADPNGHNPAPARRTRPSQP